MSAHHVLIIEDNPGDVELLREAFDAASLDCKITAFGDGESALEFISKCGGNRAAAPDIVLLDINLPRVDGLSLLQTVRQSAWAHAVPIVVMSSAASPKEAERIAAFENTTLLIKPASLDKFLEIGGTVKRLLGL